MKAKNIWEKIQNIASRIFTAGNVKKAGVLIIVCAVLAGGGVWYHQQQKQAKHDQIRQARATMIAARAAQNNLALLDTNIIRSLAAQAIGVDENKITYREISLIDIATKCEENDVDKHKKAKKEVNNEQYAINGTKNQQLTLGFKPIYKISCKVNAAKYKLHIDAITGQVLYGDVD